MSTEELKQERQPEAVCPLGKMPFLSDLRIHPTVS